MPNVRNRLTPITLCKSASQIANCLFFGSYKFLSLIMAQTFLTTSCRGRASAPINAAKSGERVYGRVKPLPLPAGKRNYIRFLISFYMFYFIKFKLMTFKYLNCRQYNKLYTANAIWLYGSHQKLVVRQSYRCFFQQQQIK